MFQDVDDILMPQEPDGRAICFIDKLAVILQRNLSLIELVDFLCAICVFGFADEDGLDVLQQLGWIVPVIFVSQGQFGQVFPDVVDHVFTFDRVVCGDGGEDVLHDLGHLVSSGWMDFKGVADMDEVFEVFVDLHVSDKDEGDGVEGFGLLFFGFLGANEFDE